MTSTSGSSKAEFHVGGKYRLVRKIGSGSFGDIYLGENFSSLYHSLFLIVIVLMLRKGDR